MLHFFTFYHLFFTAHTFYAAVVCFYFYLLYRFLMPSITILLGA